LHTVSPLAQGTQVPLWQRLFAPHGFPHPPQFWGSVCRFTHEPEQFVSPDGHETTHVPPEHICPCEQLWPQAPQLLALVFSETHCPEHFVSPAGQTHLPAEQCWPVGQTCPHVPQFLLLVCTLTHCEPHRVSPAAQPQ
jgi:hypothetical protein